MNIFWTFVRSEVLRRIESVSQASAIYVNLKVEKAKEEIREELLGEIKALKEQVRVLSKKAECPWEF